MKNFILILLIVSNHQVISRVVIPDHLITHANSTNKETSKNHKALSDYLSQAAQSENEKVLIFSYWIAKNIKYDLAEMNMLNRSNKTAFEVLRNRKAVCEGFSHLFKQLCDNAGITCYSIDGYSHSNFVKRLFSRTDNRHAWNIVYVEGDWKLIDVTWSESEAKQSSFRKNKTLTWIYCEPEIFSKSHYPNDPRWQLLKNPLTKIEFWHKKSPSEKNYAYQDSLDVLLTREMADNLLISINSEQLENKDDENYATNLIHLGWDYVGGNFEENKIKKGLSIFAYALHQLNSLELKRKKIKFSNIIQTGIRTGNTRIEKQF